VSDVAIVSSPTAAAIEVRRMWHGGPLRQTSSARISGSWIPSAGPEFAGFLGPYVCEACSKIVPGLYERAEKKWVCSACRSLYSAPRRPKSAGISDRRDATALRCSPAALPKPNRPYLWPFLDLAETGPRRRNSEPCFGCGLPAFVEALWVQVRVTFPAKNGYQRSSTQARWFCCRQCAMLGGGKVD
jgi:hypothetical protein